MNTKFITIILFSILLFTLIISAIVSAIETAITGLDFVKIETIADKKYERARKALKFEDKQQIIISTMLFLNNIVNIVATTITTILVTIYIKNIPLAVATSILTFVILVFCEITPKRIASKNPERIVLFWVDIINIILFVLFPVVSFLNIISDLIASAFRVNLNENEKEHYSEDELKTLLDKSLEQGVLETKENEIMQNALEFGEKTLYDIMIPINKIKFVSVNSSYKQVMATFINNEYTRYPVVDGSINNVVGILNIKDILKFIGKNDSLDGEQKFNIEDLVREPFFLNENIKISSAFKRMQKVYANMVVVRSNNCKTIGIATLEDIIEEIVGEIRDEFDEI